jgi:hypothetical protein
MAALEFVLVRRVGTYLDRAQPFICNAFEIVGKKSAAHVQTPESSKRFLFDLIQAEQRAIAREESRRVRPFKAHSRTIPTRHPIAIRRLTFRSSRALFSEIFARQNSGLDFGHLNR